VQVDATYVNDCILAFN